MSTVRPSIPFRGRARVRRLAGLALAPALVAATVLSQAALAESAGVVLGQEAPADRGAEIFRESARAIEELERLSGALSLSGTASGGLERFVPSGEAMLRAARSAGEDGETAGLTVLVEGEAAGNADSEPSPFMFYLSPDRIGWVDHEERLVQVRSSAEKLPAASYNTPSRLIMPELLEEEPFSADLAADRRTVEGQEEVDGVLCDVVFVEYGQVDRRRPGVGGISRIPTRQARWYIGADDRLPRKVERISEARAGFGITLVQELSRVRTSGDFTAENLDIAERAPDDYEVQEVIRENVTANPRDRLAPERETTERDERDASPGRPAPEFTLATESGRIIDNGAIEGRVSVFYFWGTWCVPCRAYSPMVSEMTQEFEAEGLEVDVYGVAVREPNRDKPFEYAQSQGFRHTILVSAEAAPDTAMQAATGFGVTFYPSIAVVDQRGNIVHFAKGQASGEARAVIDGVESAARRAAESEG